MTTPDESSEQADAGNISTEQSGKDRHALVIQRDAGATCKEEAGSQIMRVFFIINEVFLTLGTRTTSI